MSDAPEPEATADQAAPEPDPLEAAWTALLAHWDEPARHKGYVALAAGLDRLAEAAALYRTLEKEPDKAAAVSAGKELIVAQALARLEAMPRPEREAQALRRRWLAPVGAFAVLLVLDALATAVLHSRAPLSWPVLLLELVAVAVLPWRRLTS